LKDIAKTKQQLIEELVGLRREITVEAVLERVRARALSMQDSTELTDLITLLFEEFSGLEFHQGYMSIILFDEEKLVVQSWSYVGWEDHEPFAASSIQSIRQELWSTDNPFWRFQMAMVEAWRRGDAWIESAPSVEDRKTFFATAFADEGRSEAEIDEIFTRMPESFWSQPMWDYILFHRYGALSVTTP